MYMYVCSRVYVMLYFRYRVDKGVAAHGAMLSRTQSIFLFELLICVNIFYTTLIL